MEYNKNEYIYTNQWNKYEIRKRKYGKMTYYGTFETLQEARKYRDFLEEQDWDIKYSKRNNTKRNNIYKVNKNSWMIVKSREYFGVYSTREDAEKRRDFLDQHEWNPKYKQFTKDHGKRYTKHNLPKYVHYYKRDGTYSVSKLINGEVVHFGTYHTLEEAVHERDLLESIDWNLDLLDLY